MSQAKATRMKAPMPRKRERRVKRPVEEKQADQASTLAALRGATTDDLAFELLRRGDDAASSGARAWRDADTARDADALALARKVAITACANATRYTDAVRHLLPPDHALAHAALSTATAAMTYAREAEALAIAKGVKK